MIDVECEETLDRCLPEFLERDPAIEIRVGGDDRFGQIKQSEARSALVAFIIVPW